jgi:5'-deoxynucleotidase YfbR-like HD superfamily hydrolase
MERCEKYPLEALLHDASEAFMCDVPSPLKSLIPEYRVIEDRVSSAIAEQFGAIYPWPKEVKQADAEQYFWERNHIIRGGPEDRRDVKILRFNEASKEWLTNFYRLTS